MPEPRHFSAEAYAALKTAWKRLVKAAGGVDAVAACTRTTISLASEFGLPRADRFAPVDVIMDIENLTGEPLMTEALARAQGYALLPLAPRDAGCLAAVLGDLSADVGTLFRDAMGAIERNLAPDLRETLIRDLDEVARVASEARCLLERRVPPLSVPGSAES